MPLELLLYPSQLKSCISPNDLLAPRVQGNLISVKRWLASDYTVGFYQHQTPWSPWSLYSRGTSHSNMIDCNMLQFFWRNSHLVFSSGLWPATDYTALALRAAVCRHWGAGVSSGDGFCELWWDLFDDFDVHGCWNPIGSMVLVYIYIYANMNGVYWWNACYHI